MIETQERSTESRENKEDNKLDKELKAAAAMERADFLTREVKNSQQQMKNITIHMQQVIAAIKKLRAELDLPSSNDISSIEEDTHRIAKLKAQIQDYRTELEAMRGDLIIEETQELIKQYPERLLADVKELAKQKVDVLYTQLEG